METWGVVAIVIVSNFFVAATTYFTARMQVSRSDKRFEKELERAREIDFKERRREVRSQPLLKLKGELALMASKQDVLARAAHALHIYRGNTAVDIDIFKVIVKQVVEAAEDLSKYNREGELHRTLFLLDDAELVDRVEQVSTDYSQLFQKAMKWIQDSKEPDIEELKGAIDSLERNKTRIIDIQLLINKRLEEM